MPGPSERDRPELPEGYVPAEVAEGSDGFIEWAIVEQHLTDALHYWMATTRPDGRPHVVPRWGAWLDGQLFYDGSPETVHARNLAENPSCALHIGDGREAMIVEGTAVASRPLTASEGAPIAAEIGRKYGDLGYAPEPDAWSGPDGGGLVVFTPTKALAWYDFPNDLTRFRF
ncbi:MAG: pyridoxamine 5'-phosphate oxidase family protein [Acidimicrobiia bacterium]|nr:pyridoxamine 5'-phosphate oxidase family protein [Acidimicrobiia bacterium]